MNEKPWYLSKTIWINAASLLVAVLQLVSQQPWIPPSAIPVIGSVVAIANIYLRANTESKLTK